MKMLLVLFLLMLSQLALAQSASNVVSFSGSAQECNALLSNAQNVLKSRGIPFYVNAACNYCSGCTYTQNAALTVLDPAQVTTQAVSGGGDECDRTLQSNISSILSAGRAAFVSRVCTYCQGCTYTKNGAFTVVSSYGTGPVQGPSYQVIRRQLLDAINLLEVGNTLEAKRALYRLEAAIPR